MFDALDRSPEGNDPDRAPNGSLLPDCQHDLDAARGILIGLAISGCIWAALWFGTFWAWALLP